METQQRVSQREAVPSQETLEERRRKMREAQAELDRLQARLADPNIRWMNKFGIHEAISEVEAKMAGLSTQGDR